MFNTANIWYWTKLCWTPLPLGPFVWVSRAEPSAYIISQVCRLWLNPALIIDGSHGHIIHVFVVVEQDSQLLAMLGKPAELEATQQLNKCTCSIYSIFDIFVLTIDKSNGLFKNECCLHPLFYHLSYKSHHLITIIMNNQSFTQCYPITILWIEYYQI